MITINLLPPSIKSSRDYAKKNRILLKWLVTYLGLLGILYIILIGVLAGVTIEKNNYEEEIESHQKEVAKYAELEKQASALTTRLDTINRIFALRPNWKRLIEDVANRRPDGVTVSRISMDAATGSRISVAANGSIYSLGLFRNALEESPYFEFVDFQSLSKVGGSYNVTLTFDLTKGSLL